MSSGGQVDIQGTVVPTITGVTADLLLDGVATAMQSLEGFAGLVLPVLVPLTTWVQWDAAIIAGVSGFARNVMSFKTGSAIVQA